MKINKNYLNAQEMMKSENPDFKEVFTLLTKAMEENDYRAAYALGTWYLHGKYVEKDVKKGLEYIKIAASHNIPNALYDLAIAYETGSGVRYSKKKAFENFLKAALEGEKQSIYEVGRCYYYGIGIDKNIDIANIWLDKAESLGIS